MGTYRDELLATATALLAATATEAVRTGMTPSVHLEWAVDKAQALIKAVDKRAGEQTQDLGAPNLTSHHVAWAQGHDWYVGSSVGNGGTLRIIVRADETDKGAVDGRLSFQNLDKLRAWAGY